MLTREARERALARRHEVCGRKLDEHTRLLDPLEVGGCVQIQNEAGPHKNKWDISGTVVEAVGHDAYMVKVDGSGRVSKRNRQYLRPILSYKSALVRERGAVDSVKDNKSNVAKDSEGQGQYNGVVLPKSHDIASVPGHPWDPVSRRLGYSQQVRRSTSGASTTILAAKKYLGQATDESSA